MELNDTQKQTVREWVQEGAGLSEIQRRLVSEFGINMTFMDVRFLIIDQGLEIQEAERKEPEPAADASAVEPEHIPPPDGAAAGQSPFGDESGAAGGVSVELDRVTQPGAVVSGSVTFSDGVTASWMLDQLGRLALQASKPGYKPSETDVQDFQQEIQRALARQGF